MAILRCQYCGKDVERPQWRLNRGQKYCSHECANNAKRGKPLPELSGQVTLICQQCGKEFRCYRAWVRRGRRKFCSWDCKIAYQRTLTGEKSARYGASHTEEARAKMRVPRPTIQGENNPHWTGGKYRGAHGYIHVHADSLKPETKALIETMVTKSGYILEHRLVMALKLGRPLDKAEKVHHINGDTTDNKPENLVVQDNRTHSRKHREMVRRIGELEQEVERLQSLLATYRKSG